MMFCADTLRSCFARYLRYLWTVIISYVEDCIIRGVKHVVYVREFENSRIVLFKQASTLTYDHEICVGRVRRKKLRSTFEVMTAVIVVLT
jgi:hypothetical protein